jgi:hypothetical protein
MLVWKAMPSITPMMSLQVAISHGPRQLGTFVRLAQQAPRHTQVRHAGDGQQQGGAREQLPAQGNLHENHSEKGTPRGPAGPVVQEAPVWVAGRLAVA